MADQTIEVTDSITVEFDDPEMEAALPERAVDALNLMRYFHRRDEMNAEVHYSPDNAESFDVFAEVPRPNVRYSPITLAAERVASYLARLMGTVLDVPDLMRFTDVASGGGQSVRIPFLEERLSKKDAAIEAANELWGAIKSAMSPNPHDPFADPRVAITRAMEKYEQAFAEAQEADSKQEIAESEAGRCTYVFRETRVAPGGMRWGSPGDACGWNKEAGVHVQDDAEHKEPWQHVWRHDVKAR